MWWGVDALGQASRSRAHLAGAVRPVERWDRTGVFSARLCLEKSDRIFVHGFLSLHLKPMSQ